MRGSVAGAGASEDRGLAVKRIIVFLAVTFALTWAYELLVVWPAATGGLGAAAAASVQLLVAVAMLFPAVGVLAARLVTREGFVGTSMIAPKNFRRTWGYWLLGWFGPTVLITFGAVLYFALFPGDFDASMPYLAAQLDAASAQAGVSFDASQVVMIGFAQIASGVLLSPLLNIATCFGEEWGWRGYLLLKLNERMGIVPTLVASGVIWGLWHAPLTVLGHNYGTGYAGYPFVGILSMCVFCFVVGTLLSFVTLRSGSCIPAAFAHGAMNGLSSAGLLFSASGGNPFVGPAPTGIVGGAAFVVCALVMLVTLRRDEKRKGVPTVCGEEEVRS